jgi:hypothetical protein
MIFVTGFLMFVFSIWSRAVLERLGRWDSYGPFRATDWLVMLPFFGGVGAMGWSLLSAVARHLP